jgi:hypothetical protein
LMPERSLPISAPNFSTCNPSIKYVHLYVWMISISPPTRNARWS